MPLRGKKGLVFMLAVDVDEGASNLSEDGDRGGTPSDAQTVFPSALISR